jgi:hypothetical protein
MSVILKDHRVELKMVGGQTLEMANKNAQKAMDNSVQQLTMN